MTDRPLIVLSLEGLATSALGCYGSSWNQTPAIDAIASDGYVWDRLVATSDDPMSVLRETIVTAAPEWTKHWRALGSLEMLTDVDRAIDGIPPGCFDRVEAIPHKSPTASDLPAEDIVDSQLGQLIAAAIERDSRGEPWSVLWLHSDFLTRRWDAPRSLFPIDNSAETLAEPSEDVELLEVETDPVEPLLPLPPLFDAVVPPRLKLTPQSHPDLVTSWMRTYGCQIRLVDLLSEVLLAAIGSENPTFVLLGTSGFRLGQNGWIGHCQGPLRSPDVRLPLVVSDGGPLRVRQLTSSQALPGILRDLGQDKRPLLAPDQWCESALLSQIETTSSRAQFAVTTPRWFFVQDADCSQHLFLKPDDVEDFNDVGRLRDDVIEQLMEAKK